MKFNHHIRGIVLFLCCIGLSFGETLSGNASVSLSLNQLTELFQMVDTSNLKEIDQVLDTSNPVIHGFLLKENIGARPTTANPSTDEVLEVRRVFFRKEPVYCIPLTNKIQTVTNNECASADLPVIEEQEPSANNFWKEFKWDQWDDRPKPDAVKITPYMSGFGEAKVYSLKVNGNRDNAVRDGVYSDLIRRIKEVDFQIESRFNLLLRAKVNEDAEVYYNIIQEPNMPQKTDISLRIRKTMINFGDINKTYTLGSFTNITKRIDGLSVVGSEGPFNYNLGYGQLKSEQDDFSRTGDGGSDYFLRNKPVMEGSLRVWVNDAAMVENADYQVNYFDGKITFKTPKTALDNLQFSYQYTNPIEDFIPIDSHVNFLGFTAEYLPKPQETIEPLYQEVREEIADPAFSHRVRLASKSVKFESESIFQGNNELIHNVDYYIHYDTGEIYLTHPGSGTLQVRYYTPQILQKTEIFFGKGKPGIYYLKYLPVFEDSEEILVGDVKYRKNIEYQIDNQTGRVMFMYPVPETTKIAVTYQQQLLGRRLATNVTSDNYKLQFGYFKQYAKAQKDLNTTLASDTLTAPTLNADGTISIMLSNWPIVPDTVGIAVNQVPVSTYNIDMFKGVITVDCRAISASISDLTVSYYYYKEYGPAQWFCAGNSSDFENNLLNNGLYSHRILMRIEQPIKYDRNNSEILVELKKANQVNYSTLIYGKDYTIQYDDNHVNNGQIYLIFYNEYLGLDGLVYGVPANLTALDQFRITYAYTKSNVPDPGDISQEQVGFVYQQAFNKEIDFSVDVAQTRQSYSRAFLSTTNYISPSGVYGTSYSLGNPNIVENSETVYINGQPNAIRNENYYINYMSGLLTFINLNPSPSDNVYVKYSYYTVENGDSTQQIVKTGTAVNFKTNYTNSQFNGGLQLMNIDEDFSPMGATNYVPGSSVLSLTSGYHPVKELVINSSYYQNQSKLSTILLDGSQLKQNQEKIMSEFLYSPWSMLSLKYHFEQEKNQSGIDNTVSPNYRPVNNLAYRNITGMSVGPAWFQTNMSLSQFTLKDDVLSNESDAKTWQIDNNTSIFDNKANLKTLLSETNQTQVEPQNNNHKLQENENQKGSVQLTLKPLNFVDLSSFYSREYASTVTSFDEQNQPVSDNTQASQLQNYQHSVGIYPALNLFIVENPNYRFFISRSEKSALLLNQDPDVSNSYMHQLAWKFLALTTVSYKYSQNNSLESNSNIAKNTLGQEYSLSSFYILDKVFQVQSIGRRFSESHNSNAIPQGNDIYTQNDNYTNDSKYSFLFTPTSFFRYQFDIAAAGNESFSTENETTGLVRTYENSPKMNYKNNINFVFDDWIKTQYSNEVDSQEDYKETGTYATSDFTSLNSLSELYSDTHMVSHKFNNVLIPKLWPVNLNTSWVYDDYIDTVRGLKYRIQQSFDSDTGLPEVFKTKITPKLSYSETLQYLSPSINDGLPVIKSEYSNYLFNRTLEFDLNAVHKLNSQYSILANYGYKKILENDEDLINSPGSPNFSSFTTHSLGIGLQTTLIPKLIMTYTFTYKMNINDVVNIGFQNYADVFTLEYRPELSQGTKMTSTMYATYRREHNWGIGLNDFEVLQNNQLNNTTLATSITPIDNITSTAKLGADIDIPMLERSGGTIQKFIFNAEGNYVEKLDLTTTAYNYSILSFIFSGKLVF